ncbi:putative amino acid transporter PAT4 [Trypanosoma theileri]|uniref:Putative amino acid transporter PAT4 n=1 Tax=Trypanosoma theileri TaxID=67003 RepID=A0A1X0NQH3_9TRYP|nr:putative amino acid transporter PAT4 [Trypanosoma theileri]ORC86944.1 putative amino acid transporter PAT4 [Trypanosoma theileri]
MKTSKSCDVIARDYVSPLLEENVVLERNVGSFSLKRVMYLLLNLVPYGGFLSTVFNLASATLGAGVISLPSAFNYCGVIFSLILLLMVTLATIYAIRLLVETRELTGLNSYEAMAKDFFGQGWDLITAGLMWLFTFGTCVAYIISIGDILNAAFTTESFPPFLRTTGGKRIVNIIIWLIGMFTMSLPKRINSLRYVSVIAIFSILFFVSCIVVHSLQNGLKNGKLRDDVKLWNKDNSAIQGLSLFMFAYLCQVNCLEIYDEMVRPTVNKMTFYATFSMSFCLIVYVISGFFGYADFGSEATKSLLLLYDVSNNVLLSVSFIGMVIKLCVGFALSIQPARDSCYYILHWEINTLPRWKHITFCGTMSFLALVLGLFIPSVNKVFGFLGSLCGGLLGFSLPALYRMYCGNWGLTQVGVVNYVCTYILLIAGVVAVVFGTGASIYGVVV